MTETHKATIAELTKKLRIAQRDWTMHNDSLTELLNQKEETDRERRARGARDRAENRVARLWTAIQEVELLSK